MYLFSPLWTLLFSTCPILISLQPYVFFNLSNKRIMCIVLLKFSIKLGWFHSSTNYPKIVIGVLVVRILLTSWCSLRCFKVRWPKLSNHPIILVSNFSVHSQYDLYFCFLTIGNLQFAFCKFLSQKTYSIFVNCWSNHSSVDFLNNMIIFPLSIVIANFSCQIEHLWNHLKPKQLGTLGRE